MRRFVALVDGLPIATANVWAPERAARKEIDGGWTLAEHLAATQIEMTDAVYRIVFASIPRTRPVPQPKPVRIPRPGQQQNQPRRVSPFELIQALRR